MHNVHVLGWLHALILLALAWRTAGRAVTTLSYRLGATYLLVWSNLVITSLSLATFSQLDNVGIYFLVSVLLAIGLSWYAHRQAGVPWEAPAIPAGIPDASPVGRMVRIGLALTLSLAAIATVLICIHYVPNNWDTCTYRISRAYFYLGRGNLLHAGNAGLLHAGNAGDPRLSYYPFNGTLLYLFLAIYQSPAYLFNIVPALAWAMAGLGAYSLARRLGASAAGGLVAAWICMMSPAVLVQAASGNDEVQAAGAILIGIGFAVTWLTGGDGRFALLAGLGIGLGMGSKLHWGFYSLFASTALLWIIIRAVLRPEFRSFLAKKAIGAIAATVIAIPFVFPFAVCNYLSARQITATEFNNKILNTPFSFSLAGENLRASTSELFLSPLPDLVPPVSPEERRSAYAAFDRFFMECCFNDMKEITKPSPQGYKFVGPADQDGGEPSENTVWLGFFPHLLLLVCLTQVVTRKFPLIWLVPLIGFFFWHATFAMQTQYIWWDGVYYSFPAVLAAGALGPIWDYTRTHRGLATHLLLAAFVGVFVTNTLLAANVLAYGSLRNLQFLWKRGAPGEIHAVAPGVASAIRSASSIYIPYTHWGVLYWNFMRFNPAAKYTTGLEYHLPAPDSMMLLSIVREGSADLVPAKLPPGAIRGLTYLGQADKRPIFAQGRGAETKSANRSRYMLLPVWWTLDSAGRITGLAPRYSRPTQKITCCVGIEPADGIEYRYELQSSTTGERLAHDWFPAGEPDGGISSQKNAWDTFVVETRTIGRRDLIARTTHHLQTQPYVIDANENSGPEVAPPTAAARDLPMVVSIPTLAPEPYVYQGKNLTVSWLRRETSLTITNPGGPLSATLELQLATLGKPHTAVLLANGIPVARTQKISHVLWVDGFETATFNIKLSPGQNQFFLTSKETEDRLPDGRGVCFLLVGAPKVGEPVH